MRKMLITQEEIEDVLISIQAGQQTANRLKQPVAIQKICPLRPCQRRPWRFLKSSDLSDRLAVYGDSHGTP